MLNGLDLFSGIGGITYALSEWVRPVAYCEIESYAAGVLFSRMLDGSIPTAPVFPDVKGITKEMLPSIDIIYGGFPCQDISVANINGKGLEGKRSGLFFEVMRLVDEIRPTFIFLENVPAITARGLGVVTAEITKRGYDCRWTVLSAEEVGAPHIRKRWWLLAYSNGEKESMAESRRKPKGCEKEPERTPEDATGCGRFWAVEPNVGRVADGIPYRVDRIKGLGNSVVPQCAREAFKELCGLV